LDGDGDHDFEEINYFNFKGNSDGTRRVPDLSEIIYRYLMFFELYAQELGSSTNAETLKSLFEAAYLKHDNLADATRQCFTFFWNIRSGNS
jgi:hypothetical protein